MATYQPPTEILPIFDPNVFLSGDEALTYNEASKLFLKYPSAQGEENLQAINVNGIATFNSTSIMKNSLTLNGATLANRQIIASQYALSDITTQSNNGALYSSTSAFVYDNNVNNGSHNFYTNNNSSVQTNPLSFSSTDLSITTINPPTSSATNPPTNDNTTKLATTSWVQSVLTSISNLLTSNNSWSGTQIWNNTNLGSLQSNAFQPPSNDNSNYIPTTAWCQSAISAGGAYTTVVFEVSADTLGQVSYTMPLTATSYNLIIVSFGGNAGTNTDNGAGTSYMGGSGGSGQYIRYLNNSIEPSRTYCYRFTKGSGGTSTNTIGCIWYKGSAGVQADKLVQLYNGNNGSNAVGTTPGIAGTAGSGVYKPLNTTIVGSNTLFSGNNGQNGTATPTATPTIPLGGTISLAGYTTQGGVGVGQQTAGGGGISASVPTKARIILQIYS